MLYIDFLASDLYCTLWHTGPSESCNVTIRLDDGSWLPRLTGPTYSRTVGTESTCFPSNTILSYQHRHKVPCQPLLVPLSLLRNKKIRVHASFPHI